MVKVQEVRGGGLKDAKDALEWNLKGLPEVNTLRGFLTAQLTLNFLLLYHSTPLFPPGSLSTRTSAVQWKPQGQMQPLRTHEIKQRLCSSLLPEFHGPRSQHLCCAVHYLYLSIHWVSATRCEFFGSYLGLVSLNSWKQILSCLLKRWCRGQQSLFLMLRVACAYTRPHLHFIQTSLAFKIHEMAWEINLSSQP